LALQTLLAVGGCGVAHPIAIKLALPPAAAVLVAIAHSSTNSARLWLGRALSWQA